MFKKFLKAIAVSLVVIMSLEIIPVAAANEIRHMLEQVSLHDSLLLEDNIVNSVNNETPQLVSEIVSMRQENVKYFLMDDGTYTAAQYSVPVHYKDENDHWQDIDNTLEYVDSEEFTGYKNKANAFDVKFSATSKDDTLVEISKDSYSLSWKYLPSANSMLNIVSGKVSSVSSLGEEANTFAAETVSSELKYRDIEKNIDLDYAVIGSQVKENIVIKKPQDEYVFRLLLSVSDLEAIVREDGSIDFVADGNEDKGIFNIPSPYMYDEDDNYSDAVQYSINRTIGGYILTITGDKEWINAPGRSFPVTVDPIVNVDTVNCTYTSIASGEHYNNKQTLHNLGATHAMGIVGLNEQYGAVQSIWKLQIPFVPQNSTVQSANLRVYQQITFAQTATPKIINLTAAEKTFSETTPYTWNWYYQGLQSPEMPRKIIDYSCVGNEWKEANYDITDLVKKWKTGEVEDNGIMFSYEKQFSEEATEQCMIRIAAANNSAVTSDQYPVLTVTYSNNVGLEDFSSYKTYDIENSGTLYINEYTGQVSYMQHDYTAPGNRLNASVSHVYNQQWAGVDVGYGKGFDLSVNEYVSQVEDEDLLANGYDYYLKDEDGTLIYFVETDNGKYIDDTGKGLIMTVGHKTFEIDFAGQYTKWYGLNIGKKCYFTYIPSYHGRGDEKLYFYRNTTSPYNLYQIVDATNRCLSLTNNTEGRLLNLNTGSNAIKVSYTYENGFLTGITKDSRTTSFTYMSDGKLASVSNGWNTIYITYHDDDKFASLADGTTSNIVLQASYSDSRTDFIHQGISYDITAADAMREVCVFNGYGQKITNYVTSRSGDTLYGVVATKYSHTGLGAAVGESTLKNNNKLISQNTVYETNNYLTDSSGEENKWAKTISPDTVVLEASTDTAYIGEKSLKVAATVPTGSNQFFSQEIAVYEPGTYTFSGYVKTQDVEGSGAYILAQSLDGTESCDIKTKTIKGTTDSYINQGWQRLQVTVTLASYQTYGGIHVEVGLQSGSKGIVYFDCMQLEKSETANQYNMIGNSGFESDQNWIGVNCNSNDKRTTEDHISGKYSYKIVGKQNRNSYIMQTVDISSLDFSDDQIYSFIISGWGKANSASATEKSATYNSVAMSQTPYFGIRVKCLYDNGQLLDVTDLTFDTASHDWQFVSSAISIQPNRVENHTYSPIQLLIYCTYAYNVNTAYFDNIQLMAGSNITYGYDDNGNLVSAVSSDGSSVNLTYNDNNDISSIIGSDGINSFYGYGGASQHDLLHSYALGTTNDTTYDNYGNVTSETIKQSKITDNGIYFISSANLTTVSNGEVLPISLDLSYGSVAEGNTMISWKEHHDINQQFRIRATDDTNQYFTISPVCAPWMYIGLYDEDLAVITSEAAEWKIELAGTGTYRLIPKSDESKCLTLSPSENVTADLTDISEHDEGSYFNFRMLSAEESMVTYYTGSPVINYANHALASDRLVHNRTYYMRIARSNYFINMPAGLVTNQTGVSSYEYNGLMSQRFKINTIPGSTNKVYIVNAADSNMAWTAYNDNTVRLSPYTGASSQQWVIEEWGTGVYVIKAANNRRWISIDAQNGSQMTIVSSEPTEFFFYRCDAEEDMLEMTTSATYTEDGRYLASTTDERGNTEYYSYNTSNGQLLSYTDKAGLTYRYQDFSDGRKGVYADLNNDGDDYDEENDVFEPYVMYSKVGERLKNIDTDTDCYRIDYNQNGSIAQIKSIYQDFMSYTYGNNQRGNLEKVTYSNGDYYQYTYDIKGNISRVDCVSGTNSHYYTYTYDNNGNVTAIYDSQRGVTTTCYYDASGNVYGTESSDGKRIYQQLNGDNLSASVKYSWKGHEETYQFNYTEEGDLTSVTLPDGSVASSESDVFGRLETTEIITGTVAMTTAYKYLQGTAGNQTTSLVSQMKLTDGSVYSYTYDVLGNITSVTRNEEDTPFVSYEYDALSQLVRENNRDAGKTYTWSYLTDGKIESKSEYAYTLDETLDTVLKTDTYSYACRLNSYNGHSITYDAIGNPLVYYDGTRFTWKDGSVLTGANNSETNVTTYYTYDENGLRTQKVVADDNLMSVDYFYEGNKLVAADNYYGKLSDYMCFLYDDTENLIGLTLNGVSYYYVKNLQGDVIGILDHTGTLIVKYTYDAWGKLLSITDGDGVAITNKKSVAYLNPIRYRGYVYDAEIGLYYLQSRYYDPNTGRFINQDMAEVLLEDQGFLGQYNLYAYCGNNPIVYRKPLKQSTKATFSTTPPSLKSVNKKIRYNVPVFSQGQLSLCWAYCQVMVEAYYSGKIKTQQQADIRAKQIAISVNGKENWNRGGWPTDSGSRVYINNIYDLYNLLVENGPVYAYYNSSGRAHLIVVTGVDLETRLIYTNNPWGEVGIQSYDQFLQGYAGLLNGEIVKFWYCILVKH